MKILILAVFVTAVAVSGQSAAEVLLLQRQSAAAAALLVQQQAAATQAATAAITAQTAQAAALAAETAKTQATAVLVTQIVGFATLLSGLLWKAFTDTRDRRWAREDAMLARQQDKDHGVKVLEKIAEVKGVADNAVTKAESAYNEANTVNQKIESIGLRLNAPGQLGPEDHPANPTIKP
jgi:hypothetical protein